MSPGLSMNWLVRQSVLHSTGLAKYMLLRFNGSEVGSKCFGFGLFTVTLQTHQPPTAGAPCKAPANAPGRGW